MVISSNDIDGLQELSESYTLTNENGELISYNSVTKTFTLEQNISINNATTYFKFTDHDLTFDGNDKTIYINATNFKGVFHNGLNNNDTGKNNITIKNVKVVNDGNAATSYIAHHAGWVCQEFFGKGATGMNLIENCSSYGVISTYGGGILGTFAGYKNGVVTAKNCYSLGKIEHESGGIFGRKAGELGGVVTAENCYSLGTIGHYCGGIYGSYTAYNGTATATNCYSHGDQISSHAGGIFGLEAGRSSSSIAFLTWNCSAIDCYSTGNIGNSGGGIFGYGAGFSGYCHIKAWNCYSTGNIGSYGGGIFSQYTGKSLQGTSTITAYNCFSTGNIGNDGGGIYGKESGYQSVNTAYISATRCYTIGTLGSNSGGLAGYNSTIHEETYCRYETTGEWNNDNLLWNNDTNEGILKSVIGETTIYENTDTIHWKLHWQIDVDITAEAFTTPEEIDQYWVDTHYGALLKYAKLTEDITISSNDFYFVFMNSDIVFDGNNKTITIDGIANYKGVFFNGSSDKSGNYGITIKNVNVVSRNNNMTSTLAQYGGWVCRPYFGMGATDNKIENCSSNGDISQNSGGIFGQYAGYMKGGVIASGCYSTGNIDSYGGGIYGKWAGHSGGVVTAEDCYSTGTIGQRGGGIYGTHTGIDGIVKAIRCYSVGDQISIRAGGIYGQNTCYQSSLDNNVNCSATNCYSTGTIGEDGGGIFGRETGYDGYCHIQAENCYSTGNMGINGGGIYGTHTGQYLQGTSTITAYNCFATGNIGTNGGGIYGRYTGSSQGWSCIIKAERCYTIGTLGDTNSGGIVGNNMHSNVEIKDSCYHEDSWDNDTLSAVVDVWPNYKYLRKSYWIYNQWWKEYADPNGEELGKVYKNTDTIHWILDWQVVPSVDDIELIDQYWVDTHSGALLKYAKLTEDITISSIDFYFVFMNNDIEFDGNNKTITIDGISNYKGVFFNGSSDKYGKYGITIKNVKIVSLNNSTLAIHEGWVCQQYFGKGAMGNLIENCSSNGVISTYGGGILGTYAGYKKGEVTVNGCYSLGTISQESGGIFGRRAGESEGVVTANNCYSLGTMAQYSGGIYGTYTAEEGTAIAKNCHSLGDQISSQAGGIFGYQAGYVPENNSNNDININARAEYCYSLGAIGYQGGGIFGYGAAIGAGIATAIRCFSIGDIDSEGGGIFGFSTGKDKSNRSGTIQIKCSAIDCYSTGTIGTYGGGIFGFRTGIDSDSSIKAENCYSTGNIGQDGGGIYAYRSGERLANNAKMSAINCFSTGSIGAGGGGIYGKQSGYTIVSGDIFAENCYTIGTRGDSNSGGILGHLSTNVNQDKNCFAEEDGVWKNTNALATLINTTDIYIHIGTDDWKLDWQHDKGLIYIDQAWIDTHSWAVQDDVKLVENITINSNKYFIFIHSDIQFNGDYKTITIDNVTNYDGLIKSTKYNVNIIVNKIDIVVTNSSLSQNGGWICQQYFGKNATSCSITNCSSDGPITQNGGGIVGSWAGEGSTNFTVSGCSSSGTIGNQGGGIVGTNAGKSSTDFVVSGSSSSGIIVEFGGGMVGTWAGEGATNFIVSDCDSIGTIGHDGGGIMGHHAKMVKTINCTSTGDIGQAAGGIFGNHAGDGTGLISIAELCSSSGTIGTEGGGIFGAYAAYTHDTGYGHAYAIKCKSTGNIIGNDAGGIFGFQAANDYQNYYMASAHWDAMFASAYQCYSTGKIEGERAGGIFGARAGQANLSNDGNNLHVTADSCYSLGEISGQYAGGIYGNDPKCCLVINCYTTGLQTGSSTGTIMGSTSSNYAVRIVNTYSTGGTSISYSSGSGMRLINNYSENDGVWNHAIAPLYLTSVMLRYEAPNDYTSYVYGTDHYVHPWEYVAEVNPALDVNIPVTSGMNIVGSTTPGTITSSNIEEVYEYDNTVKKYSIVQAETGNKYSLSNGNGYWVNVSDDANIEFTPTPTTSLLSNVLTPTVVFLQRQQYLRNYNKESINTSNKIFSRKEGKYIDYCEDS